MHRPRAGEDGRCRDGRGLEIDSLRLGVIRWYKRRLQRVFLIPTSLWGMVDLEYSPNYDTIAVPVKITILFVN